MSNALKVAAVGGAVSAETDPNFNQTVLLLHGDGTNGAQNNTFLDSGTANGGVGFTITRNPATGPNAPTQGTFSPFSVGAGKWSNYFDGTTDWLSIADNSAFTMGSGDFTIEYWTYFLGGADLRAYGQANSTPTLSTVSFFGGSSSGNKVLNGVYSGSTGYLCTSSANFPINQWVHIAFVRDGNTLRQYINGVQDGTASVTGVTVNDSSNQVAIGRAGEVNAQYWLGYISNFRIVKGTCVYPSGNSFTPSTTPLGATSGGTNPPQGTETSLLTCQSNRFVDNSTNAFAITRNGDVRVTPFSPFAPSAAYDPAVNGGSGYLDTSGDSLTVPYGSTLALGTGDCTIEAWVYLVSYPQQFNNIIDVRESSVSYANNAISFGVENDGTLTFYAGSYSPSTHVLETASGKVSLNTWVHLALTRSSGTTKLYVNGVEEASSTNSWNQTSGTATTMYIGNAVVARQVNGYISNVRIVKGSAVTPPAGGPTAPLTAITNTSLLLNFTNAGILDNTGKNNLETVGNAQIDTTTKKYGTGSMEFDGTGDYLVMNASTPDMLLGTGPFTIEFWFNTTSSTRYAQFIGNETTNGFSILINNASSTSGDIAIYNGTGGLVNSATSVSYRDGNWHHLAFVRDSSGSRLYLNGTQQGTTNSGQSSTSYDASSFRWAIGANLQFTGRDYIGYIDDLRITKGVARYTANFTPPTKEFPDQ